MKPATIPGVDKPVSRIVLGSMIINNQEPERCFALLDDALALGVNAIDTAWVYNGGNSERGLGDWMKARGNREKVVILSKGAHPNVDRKRVTPYDITADLMDSLSRLKTGYIDIYVLHRDDPAFPVGPIVECLNEHQRAGRIRAFGGSNWTHQRIQEANDYAKAKKLTPFQHSSPNYSLAEQVKDPWGPGCVGIGGPKEVAARAWYKATQMPIFAYSSLARGFLSGRITRENFETVKKDLEPATLNGYCHEVNFKRLDRAQELAKQKGLTVPQIATSFILNQGLNVFPIVGAANKAEIAANVAAADITLTAEESAWLNLETDSLGKKEGRVSK